MRGYNSCLFSIFQYLYQEILDERFPLTALINMCSHITNFISDINQNRSEKGYLDAISKAIKDSDNCNLCSDCKKCSKLFYLNIAEIKISNFNSTTLAKEKDCLEKIYGKLSFRKPPLYLKSHLDNHSDLWENYQLSVKSNKYAKRINNNLIILKGMSSSSPYIYNKVYPSKHFTGGGIYLRFNNYGIAIDPGYGFVDNMYKYNIGIQDIDAVIITHFHIDHTNDMRIIDDLNQQFKKIDHYIDWYIDKATYATLYHGYAPELNRHHIIDSSLFGTNVKINEDISFAPFKTLHIIEEEKPSIVYNNQTFGIILNLTSQDKCNLKLGYTSDTTYYECIESNFADCDIIIANISSIYYEDYLLTYQKNKHLGYRGCYNILKGLDNSPKLFVVSEFWNGTTDFRFDVCKALANDLKNKVKIIPGDVGLHINMQSTEIRCSMCGNYHKSSDIYSVRPSEDFERILYICKDCLL